MKEWTAESSVEWSLRWVLTVVVFFFVFIVGLVENLPAISQQTDVVQDTFVAVLSLYAFGYAAGGWFLSGALVKFHESRRHRSNRAS